MRDVNVQKRAALKLKLFRFASNIAGYSLSNILARLVQATSLFLIAGALPKEQYAQVGVMLGLVQLVTLLSSAGISEAMPGFIQRFRSEGTVNHLYKNIDVLFGIQNGLLAFAFLTFAALAPTRFFPNSGIVMSFVVLTAGIVLGVFRVKTAKLQLLEQHRQAIIVQSAPLLVAYPCGVFGAWVWHDPVDGFVMSFCAGLLASWWYCHHLDRVASNGKFKITWPLIWRLFLISSPFILGAFFGWFSGLGAAQVIKQKFPMGDVADYVFVTQINGVLLLLIGSIAQVWAPRFYSLAASMPMNTVDEINRLIGIGSILLVSFVSGLLLVLYQDLISIAPGEISRYAHLTPHLAISFGAYVVLSLHYRSQYYYLLNGASGLFLKAVVVSDLFGIAIWLTMMNRLSVFGIYSGFFVFMLLRAVVIFKLAKNRWNVKMKFYELPIGLLMIGLSFMISTSTSLTQGLLAYMLVSGAIMLIVFFIERNSLRQALSLVSHPVNSQPLEQCL